ncbi:MAG TPA: AsmA-like C-terminal region-containing protein [Tepidisphaeraceae bacterium]
MESEAEPATDRRRLRRWIIIASVALLVVCGLEYGISKFLDYKLRDTIADRLDAELKIDGLWYVPPLSVHVASAALYRDEERLIAIGPSEIKLARIPLPRRPVVIESIEVDEPTIELTRDKEGFIGGPGFVKERKKRPRRAPRKLSEILQLRHFQINAGTITYTDQRSHDPLPMTWRDINVNVAMAQKTPEQYGFNLGVKTGEAAELALDGAINVDTFVLDVLKIAINVNAGAQQESSPLPAPVQRAIRKYEITGKLGISGHATLPLKDIERSTYSGIISVDDATGRLPEAGMALDRASARIRIDQATTPIAANAPLAPEPATQPAPTTVPAPERPAVIITVQSFDGAAAGGRAVIDRGQLTFDPKANHWTLGNLSGHVAMERSNRALDPQRHELFARYAPQGHVDFTLTGQGPIYTNPQALKGATEYHLQAYPHAVSFELPNFPRRIEGIGGEVRVEGGVITFENFEALYGRDQYRLRTARIPLRNLPSRVRVEEIALVAQFNEPPSEYSPQIMKYVATARPVGNYALAGWVQLDKAAGGNKPKPDYNLQISSDQAGAVVTQYNLPVQNIHTDIYATPQLLHVPRFEATTLDGRLIANADCVISDRITYTGAYNLQGARLERLEKIRESMGQKPRPISGEIHSDGTFSGSVAKGQSPVVGIKARGALEIIHGDFFRLPVLSGLLTSARFGQGIGTVGELATNYAVENRTVILTNCAINSPLVGIQGSGKIGFDGSLDLQAIVAPLANWRDKMRETKIPFVSNIAGEIVGNVQKLLNTATSNLLYEFRADGTFSDPRIRPVAAPMLSDAAAFVFGRMVQGVRAGELLRTVKTAQPMPTPPQQPVQQ